MIIMCPLFISKLPIRQVTGEQAMIKIAMFSKLPIRQVTFRGWRNTAAHVSKLPIRQVTIAYVVFPAPGSF